MRDAHWMDDVKRYESQYRQRNDRGCTGPGLRFEYEEIKRRNIPERGKAAKVIIGRFHQPVGKVQRSSNYDEDSERNRKLLRKKPACRQGICGNENIVENVHHKIEHIARPARQDL